MIEIMDGLAIIKGQRIVELNGWIFLEQTKIETINRLAIFQGQKLVKTTIEISSSREALNIWIG